MLGIKTYFKKKIFYPQFLYPQVDPKKFPSRKTSSLRLKVRLFALRNKLREQKSWPGLGDLITYPESMTADVFKNLLPFNPNNLGNWSSREVEPNQETAVLEKELIWKMINLYHGEGNNLEGYVTSGGTEANIFSAWTGRKFLEKEGYTKNKICLIKTNLTHYSVEKAADIVNVPTFVTPLNRESWGMDSLVLRKTVEELLKKGYQGFLLPLTIGYTATGTADPYAEICRLVKVFEKDYKIKFFVWIDAALNGLIEPFLNNKFSPFSSPLVQTFLVDFHKFGFVPLPAGIILYQKNLRKLIEKPIDYLTLKDNTVLGSRPGTAPVACWTAIHSLGKQGYKEIIEECLAVKTPFLKKIKKLLPLAEIVNHPKSLTLGIVFEDSQKRNLLEAIEKASGSSPAKIKILFSDGEEEKKIIFRFLFLPHITRKIINKFFARLEREIIP